MPFAVPPLTMPVTTMEPELEFLTPSPTLVPVGLVELPPVILPFIVIVPVLVLSKPLAMFIVPAVMLPFIVALAPKLVSTQVTLPASISAVTITPLLSVNFPAAAAPFSDLLDILATLIFTSLNNEF